MCLPFIDMYFGDKILVTWPVLKTGRQQRSALRGFLDRSMLLLSLIL